MSSYYLSCQCPCSGDHTFPGGAFPGSGFNFFEDVGLIEFGEEFFLVNNAIGSKTKNQNINKTKIMVIVQR